MFHILSSHVGLKWYAQSNYVYIPSLPSNQSNNGHLALPRYPIQSGHSARNRTNECGGAKAIYIVAQRLGVVNDKTAEQTEKLVYQVPWLVLLLGK